MSNYGISLAIKGHRVARYILVNDIKTLGVVITYCLYNKDYIFLHLTSDFVAWLKGEQYDI